MSTNTTVIGIDPGSRNTGWGVVSEVSGVLRLVDCGVIRPPLTGDFSSRLGVIFKELHLILARLKPEEASVEQVFTAKNAATALKLGQARGAAVAACAANDVSVRDYEPSVIKKALVGIGSADKAQVSFMVGRILGVKPDWAIDTGDALAAAICHLTVRRFERLSGLLPS
ncbi:MAG: crossover junction endodeoxyribonuclease RuvC [Bilophila sp.]